ncbi:hypothetical protein A0J61_02604 [Choanephora cucurbitarum]|uniref:Uncharacterized protein n=1 Tax=Choanephora cucurbitarum TaxID=101091 RepID=A0A1C7NJX3_9FUNG|nr:hypothetical protein A0J61_02604 [Choanephora cucurbitarum]
MCVLSALLRNKILDEYDNKTWILMKHMWLFSGGKHQAIESKDYIIECQIVEAVRYLKATLAVST